MSTENKVPLAIQEISKIDQWVAYSRTKIPISPRGVMASVDDQDTWGTLAQAKFIRQVQGLPGVGFVFTPADPYVGIDLDNAIDPITDEIKWWAQEIVDEIASYTEKSPSGLGLHIWVRGDIPQNGARRDLEDGKIEIYKAFRYFTVTGRKIGNTDTIESRDLESFFATRFATVGSARTYQPSLEWEAPPIDSWLDDALSHIPSDDYADWIKVGMALYSELGESGFAHWDHWSARSAKYEGSDAIYRKWQSFSGTSVTIASVVWLAEQRGFKMPSGIKHAYDNRVDWDQWIVNQQRSGVTPLSGEDDGLGIKWVSFTDSYRDRSEYEPNLIEPGLLSEGDIMLLFGPPKSMKSMAILDAARAWCQGKAWLDYTPRQPLKIAFAQFEVKADQMRRRIHLAELEESELLALENNFFFTDRFTPVLDADFVLSFAESVLKAFGTNEINVLVIDPVANIYTGDSENDNAQMSKFIRQIKALRNAISPKTAIILVHHANKTDRDARQAEPFNSARGGSALRGAYDAGMYIDRVDESSGFLKIFTELRNGPSQPPVTVEFVNGRIQRLSEKSDRAVDLSRAMTGDPFAEWFADTIRLEAVEGRYYTRSTFSDTFAASSDIAGSASTIKREIDRLSTIGKAGTFTRVGDVKLPKAHHRSTGYVCVRNMLLCAEFVDEGTGEVTDIINAYVVPQYMKDPRTGRLVEVTDWHDLDYTTALAADESARQ